MLHIQYIKHYIKPYSYRVFWIFKQEIIRLLNFILVCGLLPKYCSTSHKELTDVKPLGKVNLIVFDPVCVIYRVKVNCQELPSLILVLDIGMIYGFNKFAKYVKMINYLAGLQRTGIQKLHFYQ